MKGFLILLCMMMLAVPVLAEDAAPTATPQPDSVVEGGYEAPATATPVPTPEPPPLRDDPMLQNVVEIAQRIDMLAENELFMNHYTYGMATEEQIEAVSYGDHTRPVQAFHLNGQALIDALYAGAGESDRLDFTRPELLNDLVGELPEILWGRREELELSILSMLARYKVFALEMEPGCGLFFLLYEDAAPVLVTWVAGNGCVDTGAWFMPDEKLATVSTAEEMSAWFAEMGMPAVTFEEVPLV